MKYLRSASMTTGVGTRQVVLNFAKRNMDCSIWLPVYGIKITNVPPVETQIDFKLDSVVQKNEDKSDDLYFQNYIGGMLPNMEGVLFADFDTNIIVTVKRTILKKFVTDLTLNYIESSFTLASWFNIDLLMSTNNRYIGTSEYYIGENVANFIF